MSASLTPPLDGGSTTPSAATKQSPYIDTSPPPGSSASPSSVIFIIIILAFSAVVLVSVYLFLRYVSERRHSSVRTFSVADDVSRRDGASTQNSNQPQCHVAPSNSLLQSLPLFKFRSVRGNLTGGDCAVCLSKFEPPDQLRLLPLCCHAFHAECIDTWIVSNQTCPLCRSSVLPSEIDVLDKILPAENRGIRNNSERFRIEIGSVSRRQGGGAADEVGGAIQSYSLGSFEYIVNENGYEVSMESRGISDYISAEKEPSIGIPIPEPPGEVLATEVGGGRSWLRDYFDRMAFSRTTSFRSSGRFFPGSSRRTGPIAAAEDLEANRAGEEIAELFRWLSGI